MLKKILFYFVGWKVLIYALTVLALFFIPRGDSFFFPHERFRQNFPYLIWVWGNFDGHHYMEIAERGYQTFEQAFFPLFPILIKTLTQLGPPYIIAGQILSNLSLLFALLIIVKILTFDGQKKLLPFIFLSIFFFPTSFFYQAIYNDSLFLLLSVLTIYFGRQKNWVLASFFGSTATLARLNGLALFIFLIFEYGISERGIGLKKIFRSKIFAALLIPSTFLSYLLYIQNQFGHWSLLFTNLSIWKQEKIVFPLQVFFRYTKILFFHSPAAINYWVAALELLFVLFYIFLLVYTFKKIRLSYWIFAAASLIIPSLTGSFAGMPRYGLHLYPLFLSLALFLSQQTKVLRLIFLAVFLVLFFVALSLFTRGYFIA